MNILLTLYNITLLLLYIPICIALFIASRFKKIFRLKERLGLCLPEGSVKKQSFWFHAASVGEVRSLKNLVELLRKKYPEFAIVLSTMTEGGYTTAQREIAPDTVLLLPIENHCAMKKALKRYHTKIFFITDTEIWPNLIMSVPPDIPLVMLNARISDRTLPKYIRWRWLFAPLLQKFKFIVAKSQTDADRFTEITGSGDSVVVGGNIKFFLHNIAQDTPELHGISGRVAFAASTHKPEEEIFLKCAENNRNQFDQFVIAPRHIKRASEIVETAQSMGFIPALYSQNSADADVIIIDELGLLESIYKVSDKIFVGGSLANIGGHNIFEALQYEKSVAVGPHTQNFTDIVPQATACHVATVVNDENELGLWLKQKDNTAGFPQFLETIREEQKMYFDIILRCIKECIGY